MHNGFVNINGEKMSKSLGNSFFIKDALKHYLGEVLRFYLMSTHYRAPLNFSEEDLIASKKRLDKLYRLKKRVYGINKKQKDKDFEEKVLNALKDDLNISKALAYMDEFIKDANESLDKNPKDKVLKQKIVSNIEFLDRVLGIGGSDAYEYFQAGVSEEEKAKIKELIEKRAKAKKEKNFELADKIRDELKAKGIIIQDTPNGTLWEKV
jgi:cysteinyl-tRNA synthetase